MSASEPITERLQNIFEIPTDAGLEPSTCQPWAEKVSDVLAGSRIMERTGDLEGAIALLARAINLRPKEATYLNRLASLMARRGRIRDAIALLERATECAPGNQFYAQNLRMYRRFAKSLEARELGWDPPTE